MNKLKSLLLLVCSLVVSSVAIAEQTIEQNPCMYHPHLCGGGQPAATQVVRIPSRYGAVAYDADQGIVGATDNNLKSLRAAKKEAVQRCIGYGGSKSSCKVVAATRNGCNALALGGKKTGGGIYVGKVGLLQQEAENLAMQGCREMGGQKCFIAYSKCSRDPRYQVDRAIME
ncbi:hypothetical protein BWD09_11910 [Neisseria dentiae]|uniref:DUF4189 domain-containing protein n=1 Tax=Neisseria dentiae TaxID=194197 RepID=A0A1X3D2J0_9NEIS|nr:DUF4189 domain-containing protein [Neisseria dentiae]OSI13914.1 hypothetical protein BWD09_11910 [Neisseria dentiae]QMT44353.1 DUF4189 domain-containing protein [Neisseria dentiae]STZ50040.1 Uncharacterised protein [Neisseria dentiae]